MGSAGEEPYKGIDGSVGGLVWVRRRNGSWWPGRILGPDELPEGCVPTPRSGTPVKLLGREDASVDWYNLEKSKRVKPFRCGEYDDCIEKAKASASHLSKKAVKYARREDAILHALALENARLEKDFPELFAKQDTQDLEQQHPVESPSSLHISEEIEDINENLIISEDSDWGPELSQSGVSFEEPNQIDAIKESFKRRRTPNDSEDDGVEGVKRMRGLEDLGMGVSSTMRRKRSEVGHMHEFLKKKNRRRTLSKVLESTPMVFIPVVTESKVSGLEHNESKINNSLVMNNSDSTGVSYENAISLNTSRNGDAFLGSKLKEKEISSVMGISENGSSDRLFEVPLVAEEKRQSAGVSKIFPGPLQKTQVVTGAQSSQSSHVETLSLGNEEHNEAGSTSSGPADVHNMIEKGISEWQLKGKRNSRSRKTDMDDEADAYMPAVPTRGGALVSSWKSDATPPHHRLLPYRQSRFTVNPKYESSDFGLRHHHTAGSSLYDVGVEVGPVSRPHHVPYISLMSKLHGRPVIGHPISIEVLDDGFCDELLGYSFSECYSSSSEPSDFLGVDTDRRARGRRPAKRRSKKNGLLSKKTRKLSSLTGSQRQHSQHEKKPVFEKVKGPSIACVPLKVVFSRINAALNSSIRPPPRLNTSSV